MAAVPVSLGYGFRAGVSYSVFNEQFGFPVFTYILQCKAGKYHDKLGDFFCVHEYVYMQFSAQIGRKLASKCRIETR